MAELAIPTDPVALVFPGQGSQFVGMGTILAGVSAAAQSTLDEADATLGFPLSELMASGPDDELEDTINAQPAILAVSIAAWRAMSEVSSPVAAIRRSWMPVRCTIHSSEVSTLLANSSLVTTRAGR